MRIVSLLPSATEIVCALGARDELVGTSHECDYPDGVGALPALSASRVPKNAASLEIDRSVRSIVAHALSVYEVKTDALRALRPDIIFTQAQCEVCAVSEDELRAALENWTSARPRLVALSPERLDDVWASIMDAGAALGRTREADACVASVRARLGAIGDAVRDARPVSVVSLEWTDPPMNAGSWSPELTALAGGRELLGVAGAKARCVAIDEIAAADPDVLLITPCGFGLPRARAEAQAMLRAAQWQSVRAVREGRVYACDGNHYFNRPGPRLVDTAEIIAEILHPACAHFEHEGTAWERISV